MADPYANEPKRHRALIVRSPKPFNAETPKDALGSSATTPNELFYVRNHLPVPHVEPGAYSVSHAAQLIYHSPLLLTILFDLMYTKCTCHCCCYSSIALLILETLLLLRKQHHAHCLFIVVLQLISRDCVLPLGVDNIFLSNFMQLLAYTCCLVGSKQDMLCPQLLT